MSKHTPGPWSVDAEDSDLFTQETHRIWINADGMHICYVDGPRNPERLANARLIVAAPDLLEALIFYMSAFGQHLEFQGQKFDEQQIEADKKARAAIAKAIGEQE
jgi:hypothetical protein